MIRKLLICVFLTGALLILPFCFRPEETKNAFPGEADKLVIITAHNKSIRDEYETAFRRYYRERFGRDVILDFRTPGGTSAIYRYIQDRFTAEFRAEYEKDPVAGPWNDSMAKDFCDPASHSKVRKIFLDSGTGIGIDLFAGGGTYEQRQIAEKGFSVDGGVQQRHPEYFDPAVIPAEFAGETLYDPQGRYYGVVLSTFGILCNLDRMREMNDPSLPRRWRDLGEPRFFRQLILADPTRSGSANKCFEIILQQCMAEAPSPDQGWNDGINLLKRLFANARSVSDSASRVTHEIGAGEAAAGTAIDTYAFAEYFWSARCFDGQSKLRYISPAGGTAISADPIQLLRGAPHRKTAEAFIDFLLSAEGQKLHAFRAGIPGGAERNALNRPPIRKDIYTPENLPFFFAPEYDPYRSGADFRYRPEWTAPYFDLHRQLIKALMLDPQEELCAAWGAIIANGGPEKLPEAWAVFCHLPFSYGELPGYRRELTRSDPARRAVLLRRWSDEARRNYLEAERLAKEGR